MDGTQTFAQLSLTNPAGAVRAACNLLLGDVGGCVAVLGVVILAITSGDTAMRSCRLMLADVVRVRQVSVASRLAMAFPLFAVVIIISQLDFSVIWRYFGWGNQTLACITLWTIVACLRRRRRPCIIAFIPAVFMTCVCATFLFYAPECGIQCSLSVATTIGIIVSALAVVAFLSLVRPKPDNAE